MKENEKGREKPSKGRGGKKGRERKVERRRGSEGG